MSLSCADWQLISPITSLLASHPGDLRIWFSLDTGSFQIRWTVLPYHQFYEVTGKMDLRIPVFPSSIFWCYSVTSLSTEHASSCPLTITSSSMGGCSVAWADKLLVNSRKIPVRRSQNVLTALKIESIWYFETQASEFKGIPLNIYAVYVPQ